MTGDKASPIPVRKRPLAAEAMQLEHDAWDQMFAWLESSGARARMTISSITPHDDVLEIETSDGCWSRAYTGDWIVRTSVVDGRVGWDVVDDDIFTATFEFDL